MEKRFRKFLPCEFALELRKNLITTKALVKKHLNIDLSKFDLEEVNKIQEELKIVLEFEKNNLKNSLIEVLNLLFETKS